MTIFGVTITGLIFAVATVTLFAWGAVLGIRGIRAAHPPFGSGGYTPAPAEAVRKAA